jgi:outer membrane protein insertion porin family
MRKPFLLPLLVVSLLPAAAPAHETPGEAQAQPGAQAPVQLPPGDSEPLVRFIELAFPTQGGVSVIESETYLYYIQTRPSRPSDGVWVPYDEQTVLADFRRLWNTGFLDDLWIEVKDAPYPNGAPGKHIIFNMEERQRVRLVDYQGTGKLELTKIDEALKEREAQIRIDSFIDQGLIRRAEGVLRELYSDKGHQYATVTHELKELPGGPKLAHLTFHIDEGPRVRIRDLEFAGNRAMGDRTLRRRVKDNRPQWFLSFITGRGVYQESKFEEDADRLLEYYRDRGYITARVGEPDLKVLEDSPDGRTRWVNLRVPITEGERYRVGSFDFDGNTVVPADALRPLFKLNPGDFYSEKRIRKGLEKAREVYGAGGYFEFTAYPDLRPRDLDEANGGAADGAAPNGGAAGDGGAAAVRTEPTQPVVDITMRVQEGQQYFVNRITFVGNTTTRDHVIRREMRLVENGVFNTEALKFSVRRLNQLGYFKPLEGEGVDVEKTPGADNKVDVKLTFEEQNRNQITFGAGASQFEGFFGQLSFQTSNFMGRGETLTAAVQAGSRARNYQLAFTNPFLFDRPITGGIDLFKREIRFISQFTQDSIGGNVVLGFPVADFTRLFTAYSYEQSSVKELNEFFLDENVLARNPFLRDALLIGAGGRRTISKITPSLVHNTVDNPMFPNTGRRYTASIDLAGVGGDTNFYKPRVEGVWFLQHTTRTSLGLRAQAEYVAPFAGTETLPIFERLFLGGEYSVRGFDIRTIGPRDLGTPELPGSFLVIGGNKSLLFNAEYLISVAGPVRLVLFYDAGQVQDTGHRFGMRDFKTSTGAEVRFFMPVLNVPFRLIFAYNPQREGVFDNRFEPQKKFTFRFAVGSTF